MMEEVDVMVFGLEGVEEYTEEDWEEEYLG
jgi:hypothetical protein